MHRLWSPDPLIITSDWAGFVDRRLLIFRITGGVLSASDNMLHDRIGAVCLARLKMQIMGADLSEGFNVLNTSPEPGSGLSVLSKNIPKPDAKTGQVNGAHVGTCTNSHRNRNAISIAWRYLVFNLWHPYRAA